MQGQRGTVGSLPETLDFDLGSSSNNATIEQQICWNSMRNPSENRIPDYLLAQSDMDIAFVNSLSRERQSMNRWLSNEASSSNAPNEVGRDKLELGWSSSSPCTVSAPRFEDQRRDPANNAVIPDNSANLMFAQSSNTNPIQPSLNLGFMGRSGSNSQVAQYPNTFKFGGSEDEQSRMSGSDRFLLPSGSSGFMVGEIDGRQSSMNRGQVSCKRKAIEGSIGPSSSGGSSSYFQRSNSSSRPVLPAQNGGGSSGLSIYTSSEQGTTPRLGLGFTDPNATENPESSHRNLRMRTSSSMHQNSVSPSILSSGRAARRPSLLSSQPSMNLLQIDHSLDLRPISAVESMRNPSQLAAAVDVPPLPQAAHSLRWSGGSSSRSGAVAFGDRDSPPPREEPGSRRIARVGMPDHHMSLTEFRNLMRLHPPNRSVNMPGPPNGDLSSRSGGGSSSNVNPAPVPALPAHHQNPQQQHPRRFSEYLRRSLFATVGSESGGQGSNYAALRAGQVGPSQEMGIPGGGGSSSSSHARLASWLERHNDNGLGIHHSLRALGAAAAGEGATSTRLVSEIRNVLGLIRRGESLRFEDVMILDPVFAGMADMHDRHRDMRLDVDNMSYEELLALEERIGNVSTGLSEETVVKCLKQKKYTVALKPQSENEPCCVCQEDYNQGEEIGTLECGHDFHKDCIKQWLTQKNLCPICKMTALKI